MKKVISEVILSIVCILLLYLSPDVTSIVFVGVMVALIAVGYGFGIRRIKGFSEGFLFSINLINDMKNISASDNWLQVKQMDALFRNRYLDAMFLKYKKKVAYKNKEPDRILPDIEDSINEDCLALNCQKNFVNSIPGILTGLGILGTFYGLATGIGGIRFSSADVVIDSISSLIGGINIAFYTSIAGVTLSLFFDIITKISWNQMLENMLEFYDKFHERIIPSESEQKESKQLDFYKKILHYIESKKH